MCAGIIPVVTSSPRPNWYAVRCVFAVGWPPEAAGKTYEERITLWQAGTAEEAIARAEAEAREHAAVIEESPSTYLGLAQLFHLFGPPADGAEVFSLMRTSDLHSSAYLDAFFDTGDERQQQLP